MKTQNQPIRPAVAGVVAPAPRLTAYALFLIATVLSALVALPLWVLEWWL